MTCRFCDTTDEHSHDWSEVFGYSTYGDGIWFDRFEIGGDVTGAPATRHGAYLGDLTGDCSYADGGQTWRSCYGFPEYDKEGSWICGWGAMRFLCHLFGVRAPGRTLKSEPFVPDQEILALVVTRRLGTGDISLSWWLPVEEDAMFDKARPFDHLDRDARSFWVDLYRAHLEFGLDPGVPAPAEVAAG